MGLWVTPLVAPTTRPEQRGAPLQRDATTVILSRPLHWAHHHSESETEIVRMMLSVNNTNAKGHDGCLTSPNRSLALANPGGGERWSRRG